jgi:hypothetical protein
MVVPAQEIRCWILTVETLVQSQVMEEVTLKQVFFKLALFSPANHHSTIAQCSLLSPPAVCGSSDQTAYYHPLV